MTDLLDKFNSVLIQFLNEIDKLYPESQAKTFHGLISVSLKANKSLWINLFAKEANKHDKEIMTKDEHYFLNGDLKFVEKLNLNHYYKISNKETRENIWKYIQTLYLLSCSYNGYNSEILENVKTLAQMNGEENITSESVRNQLEKMK